MQCKSRDLKKYNRKSRGVRLVNYQKVYGLLGLATKAGKITAGTEACLEEIDKKNIKLVLMATDASERTKKIFHEKCEGKKIPIYELSTMEELSRAIGKNNKAVIGIKDKGFMTAIYHIINGGDMIG